MAAPNVQHMEIYGTLEKHEYMKIRPQSDQKVVATRPRKTDGVCASPRASRTEVVTYIRKPPAWPGSPACLAYDVT
jgi:hypothetical protein